MGPSPVAAQWTDKRKLVIKQGGQARHTLVGEEYTQNDNIRTTIYDTSGGRRDTHGDAKEARTHAHRNTNVAQHIILRAESEAILHGASASPRVADEWTASLKR